MQTGDTIVAISSAVAPAARIIVRASGPGSVAAARELSASEIPPHNAAFRTKLAFAGLPPVSVWLYIFHAPRSYTGEDLVEFHIPGSPLLATLLLKHLVDRPGLRHATAGEFTARAYFNGRLDLTEAEGVAATIGAGSEAELRAARQLLSGELALRLRPAMEALAEMLALVEVGIDFSEEDLSFLSPAEVAWRIQSVDAILLNLITHTARFERLAHGPTFIFVGRPNVGKSTLLNALAGHERAVVSPVAGTTRDVLSADVTLEKGIVRIIDAAGLEQDDQPSPLSEAEADIAQRMRRQALSAAEVADFLVFVCDLADTRPPLALPREPDLRVWTKADLHRAGEVTVRDGIMVSAATGTNLDSLRDALGHLAFGRSDIAAGLALNARHIAAISESRAALSRAQAVGPAGQEVLALELRDSLDALGRVLGHVSPDDLLGRIFSSFCIGK